jgi:hypothetical protein
MKANLMVRISKDLIDRCRMEDINISKFLDDKLKEFFTEVSLADRVTALENRVTAVEKGDGSGCQTH